MTAPMIDYKIHWLKMMSVPESQAVVGRHDGINGRDSRIERRPPRLNLDVYPYLPRARVAMTSAKSYMSLLSGLGA